MRFFHGRDNSGAGPIPKELGSLTKLETLLLEQNFLSGKDSKWLVGVADTRCTTALVKSWDLDASHVL